VSADEVLAATRAAGAEGRRLCLPDRHLIGRMVMNGKTDFNLLAGTRDSVLCGRGRKNISGLGRHSGGVFAPLPSRPYVDVDVGDGWRKGRRGARARMVVNPWRHATLRFGD